MYGALRPLLRAQRRPARLIHRRRYPSQAPSRARRLFHSTPTLANDPNAPPGADGRPLATTGNGEAANKAKREEESAATAVDKADGGIAAEDPELLAHKLQRSKELARRYSSALRRTQRRNRAQDLPPVVLPDWFLRERVFLRDQPRGPSIGIPEFTLSLRHRDGESVAQCSIPIADPSIGVMLLARWISTAWGGGVSPGQSRQFAKKLAAAWGLGQEESVVDALVRGDGLETSAEELRTTLGDRLKVLKDELAEARKLMGSSGKNHLAETMRKLVERDGELAKSEIEDARLGAALDQTNRYHVSPFVLAEIRATLAASLSVIQPSGDTYPAARTNLTLHSPFSHLDSAINQTVKALAADLGADVIELSALDLADLAGDYLGEGPEPSPHSIRSLGYETYRLSSDLDGVMDELGNDGAEDDDGDAANPFSSNNAPRGIPGRPMVFPLSSMLKDLTQHLKTFQAAQSDPEPSNEGQGRAQTPAEIQLEDLKLANLLENIISSTEAKRSTNTVTHERETQSLSFSEGTSSQSSVPGFFDLSLVPATELIDLDTALPHMAVSKVDISVNVGPPRKGAATSSRSKIIFVQDIKELSATQYGSRIMQKLEEIVRKLRNAGESIMIVGTTCSRDLMPELSVDGVQGLQADGDSGFFRNIVVPAETVDALRASSVYPTGVGLAGRLPRVARSPIDPSEKQKYRAINLRHLQTMLRSLDPLASRQISTRLEPSTIDEHRSSKALLPDSCCTKVLTHDEIHRIAITTLGLRLVDPACELLSWDHVALAMGLLKASDEAKFEYIKRKPDIVKSSSREKISEQDEKAKKRSSRVKGQQGSLSREERKQQLQTINANANSYERRLMSGIVNPDQIKTGFDQVHVPSETIEAIRTLTSLSFMRPDAFNYGVLATEKISGALLYGPPGTGKTLLAKAVAKESGCAVLEVSGSQIHDKYVGEGEKNVTAIFSLARKLSPCVVFLDEADAVLSSRDTGRERASARDILNQFLKEWDGLSDHSVFVMVATNRPFDLDDAVIRRLPRRLLVDLPTENDRKEILKIHLRGEQLDDTVNVESLAKQTPFYSGSDLKNIAVAAALACVKEENATAIATQIASTVASEPVSSQSSATTEPSSLSLSQTLTSSSQLLQGTDYKFPDKRILHTRHFEKALQEISASISEDMSSLNAIKKFDEKYGDKKGKKKKTVFGIGLESKVNEGVARVRG